MKAKSCALHPGECLKSSVKDVETRAQKGALGKRLADAALVASTIALFAVLFSALRGAFLSAQWGPF